MELDYIREDLKSLSTAMKVLVLVKGETLRLEDLNIIAKENINSMAASREVPAAIEKGWLFCDEDENVSVSLERINRLFESILNLLELREETSDEGTSLMWQEMKEYFFERQYPRAGQLFIKNEKETVAKEEVEVYPYFPETIPGCIDKRAPIFSNTELLSVDGIKKRNVKIGSGIFDKIREMKQEIPNDKGLHDRQKAEILRKRKEAVRDILADQSLTEEAKLAQYLVLTKMDPIKENLLYSANKYGLKAEKMIMYLEEPGEIFSFETIEGYIRVAADAESASRALQLARDLVDGRWTIEDSDGINYKVYPEKLIEDLKSIIREKSKGDSRERKIKHGGR